MSPTLAGLLPDALCYTVVEGPATSVFLRQGPVAAQLLLTRGTAPRLIVAFAAGNSGAGVWFAASLHERTWRVLAPPRAISGADAAGRPLHGLEVELEVDADHLVVERALLGSVRVLRDHQFDGRLPSHGLIAPAVQAGAASVAWARDRLDGAAGYRLELQLSAGRVQALGADGVRLDAPGPGMPLRLRLKALSGDEPLVPISADQLLTDQAADLPNARHALEFLAYEEKWLAGSWRFHTYFGRDTLMALRMLLPVLQPAAIEAGLASVITRLDTGGAVAHEEDIGEFPILTRLAAGEAGKAGEADQVAQALAAPMFDYKMVDDDFLLLPVAAAYLIDTAPGRARAAAFLARCGADGRCFGQRLMDNAALVLGKARPFADAPAASNLVRLGAGQIVGDWRDSADGLGGGVYSYSVNAVLVPAALRAVQAFDQCGLLAPFKPPMPLPMFDQAVRSAGVWSTQAPRYFEVVLGREPAQAAVDAYAAELGLPRVVLDGDLAFSALSLDEAGRPVPVMHSDFGFALLLGDPAPDSVERELTAMLRPFPAGLMTDAGMVVANAVLTDPALRLQFGADRYHGAVVWSWQQAMLAAGLARQIARHDLPHSTRCLAQTAQSALWSVILGTRDVAEGELWSWGHDGRRFHAEAFGPKCHTADESNAAQLWSTVYLAVKPPPPAAPA